MGGSRVGGRARVRRWAGGVCRWWPRLWGRDGAQLARNVRFEGPHGAVPVAQRALIRRHAPVARDVMQQRLEGDLRPVHRVHALPVGVLLPPVHAHVRGGARGAAACQRRHVVRVAEPVAHRRAEGGRDLRVENRRIGDFGRALCPHLQLPLGPPRQLGSPCRVRGAATSLKGAAQEVRL